MSFRNPFTRCSGDNGSGTAVHAGSHNDGGTDELTVQDLGSGSALSGKLIETDGSGGLSLIDTPITASPAQTIIVAKSGGDYSTIADALSSISDASSSKPYSVLVYPGVYSEVNPISMKEWVSVLGMSGAVSVEPATDTGDPVFSGKENSELKNLLIRGANSSGGVGVEHSASGIFRITNVIVTDCETGFLTTGLNSTTEINNCQAVKTSGGSMLVGLSSTLSAVTYVSSFGVRGLSGDVISKGLSVVDGQLFSTSSLFISHTTNAVFVDDGAFVHLSGGVINNCVNGINIGSTGPSEIQTFSVNVINASAWDLIVNDPDDVVVDSGSNFNHEKISIEVGASVLVAHTSNVDGDRSFRVIGEFSVGDEYRPTESTFGGGDSHTRGMSVFRNTNLEAGTWSDITVAMTSASGSTSDAFAGVAVNNSLYIGGDYEFPGIKVATTTEIVGGSFDLEYWDGLTWKSLPFMATKGTSPYTEYAKDAFSKIEDSQILFKQVDDWAKKTLDGSEKYWVRFVVDGLLTTSPAFEQIKIHTSRTEINGDGRITLFGEARDSLTLPVHRILLEDQSGSAPGNGSIPISSNLTLAGRDNKFVNGNIDARSGLIALPSGIDTSHPLTFSLLWFSEDSNVGNIEWELTTVILGSTPIFDGSGVEVLQSEIETVPSTGKEGKLTTFEVDVSTMKPGEWLAFKVERDADAGNADDTSVTDVVLVGFGIEMKRWR